MIKYKKAITAAAGLCIAAVLATAIWTNKTNPEAGQPDSTEANRQSLSRETAPPSSGPIITVSDVVVEIDGEKYDITELCDAVNAVMGVSELGDYIVVEGHINPRQSFHGFFHTVTGEWEYSYVGGCLTWDENWEQWDNPIESIIYAVQGMGEQIVYDYQENEIAVVELQEGEYIRELKRAGDHITAIVCTAEGGTREVSL